MQRIDFYVLNAGPGQREQFTCRLTEKAYDQGLRVYILAQAAEQLTTLDELLWTFRPGSFLPHAPAASAAGEPIVLGTEAGGDGDLLINLRPQVPAEWRSYQRLAEVVEDDPASLEAARRRFRQYRQAGLEPHYHKLNRAKA